MKILILNRTDLKPLAIKAEHIKKLKSVSKEIEIFVASFSNKQKIEQHLKDANIIAGAPMDIPSITNVKNLKWIHSFSAGVEAILTPEIINSDIIVTNVSGIHKTPIAEHVIGFMLIFTRKFYDTFENQKEKMWKANQNLTEIAGKTILVVGLGHIGTEVARLSNCFAANVIAIKHNIKNKPSFVDKLYSSHQLNKLLPKANFVVLCLPLTKETHHLFDMKKFKLMKQSAILINIGRGRVVHEKELIEALDKKIIGGAALDVTEEEPLPKENPLWKMENVVITPHHSGWSEKYMDRAIDVFCRNLKAYLSNKPLPNLVNKRRGY